MISFWISWCRRRWTKLCSRSLASLPLERGAGPSIRDELLRADADGWLHMLDATRWHDSVTRQIHDLIQSRKR
jgi:hypothetical protein